MGREAEESDIERRLRRLGSALRSELATRDIAPAVVETLRRGRAPARQAAPPRRARHVRRVRRATAVAAVSAVVMTSAAWTLERVVFDGGAVTVHRGPGPASTTPATGRLDLGQRISLGRARALPGFLEPRVPWLDASPAAWLDPAVPEQLSLSYPPGPGLPEVGDPDFGLVVQTFAADGREVIRKYLATDTTSQRVQIAGADAVFLQGGDHTLFYLRPDGRYATVPGRLVGNALILRHGELTVRIETQLPLPRLVELATSLGGPAGG
jgi:hypothetical protein